MLLDGTVAVVSGVGPGLGREAALALAREGADVVVVARTEARLVEVAGEIETLGRRAVAVPADVTDPDACRRVADTAVEQLGRVDVLVNNAFHTGDMRSFVDADLDRWRRTMDVNLFGTLGLTQALVPALAAGGAEGADGAGGRGGRIVMVNTMSTQRIRPAFGAYAASKGALATATKTLALELGPLGIRVNAIHPGYIWADSVRQWFAHLADQRGVSPEDVYREVAAETALRYLPSAAEVAGSVVFFASELSRPITGQALAVNAGHWFA